MTSTRPLRIAVTADPELPVPPKLYGGAERLVDMLVRGLVERGHDVTLFAHPDSDVPCRLEPYPGCKSQSKGDLLRNMFYVSSKILQGKYDLVHSFGRLVYLLPLLPLSIPKLMSYERSITARSIVWGERLSRGTLHFTGCSHYMMKSYVAKSNWHLVYPGVPRANYGFREEVDEDAPLIFLGRVEEIKGAHLAIEVARRSGRSLVIAGNVPEEAKHQAYFEEKISAHIDGKTVQYVGPVTDGQKDEWLGRAVALVMPILWEEPFGMVMAEALACGTPVIGFRRGAVAEVVRDGYNGFVCESIEEMVAAVRRIKEIDRKVCRQIMEEKFSDCAVVDACEKLYIRLLENKGSREGAGLFSGVLRRFKPLVPLPLKRRLKFALGVPDVEASLLNMRRNGFTPKVAIDVGAYRGDWSRMLKRVFPAVDVLMVEAQASKRSDLERVILELPGIELASVLVGPVEKAAVGFYEGGTASSVLLDGESETAPSLYLPMTTLDAVVKNTRFACPDFIKLDVQGYELHVLEGASAALSISEAVLMEVNLIEIYKGAALFHETVRFMADRGFQVYDICSFFRRPYDKALFQMDVIFVRSSSVLVSSMRWS